jgi:large-conductance mechanosensitive channel
MHNTLTCKNCSEENPFYALICKKCHSYLRDMIYNIDLWKILGLLIESPSKAFSMIIQSEHKNFISIFIVLATAKFYVDTMFFSIFASGPESDKGNVLVNYLIILGSVIALLLIAGIIITRLNKMNNLNTRLRDNFAILAYSLLPHIFAFIILFTVEASVFGTNLFAKNPSVFSIKELMAYTLLGFEIIVALWAMFLSVTAVYVQSKDKVYSIVIGVLFNISLYLCLYINSRILY